MSARPARMPLAPALLALLAAFAPAAARAESLVSSTAFAREISAAGRAEVTLRYSLPPAPGASPRVVYGSLSLEPPGLVRLDVPATGERIAARADGGEWLQPATKQLLRFGSGQVTPALRWWRVLLGEAALVRERRLAPGKFALVMRDESGVADSAVVWLDARGLPSRLEVAGAEGAMTYRLSGWRFRAARGAASFRLKAPAGFETITLP